MPAFLFAYALACTSAAPPDGETDTAQTSDTSDTGSTDDTGDTGQSALDYSQAGPFAVSATSETASASCEMELERFTPVDVANPPLVILSHGFARDRKYMVEMGEHFASWGFDVAVPTLCKLKLTSTDHPQNGQDLVTLADTLGGSPIYVGYSAGGLASVLAAQQDPSAVGFVGLDPVDSEDLGLAAAGTTPQRALFAEAGSCNASNNGVAWFQAGEALRVNEANHCDFEGPTDALCTVVCASGSESPDPLRREVVWALSAAAVLGLSGDAAALEQGWTPGGSDYERFSQAGRISTLP